MNSPTQIDSRTGLAALFAEHHTCAHTHQQKTSTAQVRNGQGAHNLTITIQSKHRHVADSSQLPAEFPSELPLQRLFGKDSDYRLPLPPPRLVSAKKLLLFTPCWCKRSAAVQQALQACCKDGLPSYRLQNSDPMQCKIERSEHSSRNQSPLHLPGW